MFVKELLVTEETTFFQDIWGEKTWKNPQLN